MRTRGMTVVVALALAAVATLTVYLYVRGLQTRTGEASTVQVVVSKADIVAGTELDDLLEKDAFTTLAVPQDALVAEAVTDLSELEGKKASVPILAGEQISTARFAGSEDLPGGTLGIPEGFQALSIPLDSSRVGGGAIKSGDRVRILATFVKKTEPVTVVLVPHVVVLQAGGGEGESRLSSRSETIVTMALKPTDTQKVVFAQEEGRVWLALLPPDEKGTSGSPVGLDQVVR